MWLRPKGIERRIALVVPGYIEALHVTARTDLVAFVPRRLIRALSKQLSLATIAPPLDPGIDEQFMFYPTRAQMDPGSIWLRNIMLGIGREMERGKKARSVGWAKAKRAHHCDAGWMVGTAQAAPLPTLQAEFKPSPRPAPSAPPAAPTSACGEPPPSAASQDRRRRLRAKARS